MQIILVLILVTIFSETCSAQSKNTPTFFAPNVINSDGDDYNPTFTPDGKTVFFTHRQDRKGNESIVFSDLKKGKWSVPQIASFSGKFLDKDPFVSPDGKRIFFASTRPNSLNEKANFDIWFVEKTADGWSEAKNLGEVVNSAGYDNYPSVAADGTLYFGSVRKGGRGENDLYRSRLVNGVYQKPENLGDFINTHFTEADPFIAPDQSYLIFCSDREGGEGAGDLYVSFNKNGSWTIPQSFGKLINTNVFDYTPLISPDGKTFYFSRGWGDIFEISASVLDLPKLKQTAKENFANAEVKLEEYLGEYEIKQKTILTVTAENGQIFGNGEGKKIGLKMITADRFAIPEADIYLTFLRESGKVTGVVIVENGEAINAKKIK